MRGASVLAAAPLACVVLATPAPAQAAERSAFEIDAGPLDRALLTFARQAGISIAVSDPALRRIRVRGLKGRYTLRGGLGRLLRGSGYDFRISDGSVVELVRRSAPRADRPPPPASASAPRPSPPAPPRARTIIVTATKQDAALADYPGSVHVAELGEAESLRRGAKGSEVLLRELPNLTTTDLGSGRNKIFIRGIADSSFNGQTQATISQYLGESRLIYSAPDPDLALYDVERVEVLEGPQGTLYGAGSLGGVIRLVPRAPLARVTELIGSIALSTTASEVGGDAALVANVPLGDTAALRVVGYVIRRPGYIDDLQRGLADINRTNVSGLRATVRFEPLADIELEAGIAGQNTTSRDGQYTDAGTSALTRRSMIAQPFDNDYRLAFVTVRASLGDTRLVSNTSYADHAIDTVFDATPAAASTPLKYVEDLRSSLLTHETRLSGASGPVSSWVAGLAIARNIDHVERRFGTPDNPPSLSDVRSSTLDAAVFGEATVALIGRLSVTAGGRISYIRQVEEPQRNLDAGDFEPVRTNLRFLPTAALSWKPRPDLIAYLRYQQGYRPGAQQITGAQGALAVTRFEPDEIATTEAGVRFGTSSTARLLGGLSFAYSRWTDVQADLVTEVGFAYVANLGSGLVRYASADLGWRPNRELYIEASGFIATSHLDRPAPAFAAADEHDLPSVADSGWRLTGRYAPAIGAVKVSFDASVGYIGTSYLAIGAPFELTQGDYLDTSLGVRADVGNWGLSVDVDNLLDSRANRFSYGNPFSVAQGNQRTPLRPRTLRIGLDARF